jgi:hypothetical protein
MYTSGSASLNSGVAYQFTSNTIPVGRAALIQVNPTLYTAGFTGTLQSVKVDATYNPGTPTTTNVFFQGFSTAKTSYSAGGYSCTIRNTTGSDLPVQLAVTVTTSNGTVTIPSFAYNIFFF